MSSGRTVVRIREKLVHMGDDEMSEWSVVDPMGREWTREFKMNDIPPGKLYFQAEVWHTQAVHNEVEINGHRIGHLPRNKSDSYKSVRLPIPNGILKSGPGNANVLKLTAGKVEEHGRDIDDFLIHSLRIVTSSQQAGPGDQAARLFSGLRTRMAGDPWLLFQIPGFQCAGFIDAYPENFVCGFFDADENPMPAGAHAALASWVAAHDDTLPNSCMAVAVFARATAQQIHFLTSEARGGKYGAWTTDQSLTGVIDLGHRRFHPPEKRRKFLFSDEIAVWIQDALNSIYGGS